MTGGLAAGEPRLTQDAFLDGRMRLVQPAAGHRIGTDAILLAAMAVKGAAMIADMGSGAGGAGIAAALMNPAARLLLADKHPGAVELAGRNLALNGLASRGEALCVDFFRAEAAREAAGLRRGSADMVLTNPPFLCAAASRTSPDAGRSSAHTLSGGTLDQWIAAAASVAAAGGHLALIHRADALADVLAAMSKRFGGIRLRFAHPRQGEPAARLLALGVKGSRAPLAISAPLILHRADGKFTAEAEAIHRQLAPSI